MYRSIFIILAVVALVAGAAPASVTFTVGCESSVTAYPDGYPDTDEGLGIRSLVVAPPTPASFTLDVCQTETFDFFEIWTHESTMNTTNDHIHRTITAVLDLSPPIAPVIITGVTYASTSGGAHGVLDWDNDGLVTVVDSSMTYTVQLSDATFNWGSGLDFGGTGNDGYDGRAMVTAAVHLVPEPATVSLLALGAVGLLARRRRKQAGCAGNFRVNEDRR